MHGEQFVIRLKDGRYWIDAPNTTTGNPDAAAKYTSRWVALVAMSKAGIIMHQAEIIAYQRPSERDNIARAQQQPSAGKDTQ